MRPNRLRELMDSQSSAVATAISLGDSTAVELAGLAGIEVVIVDTEHAVTGLETVLNHLRAAQAHDLAVIVRVPSQDESDILRVLDAGAHGVLVPHVDSAETARRVASYVRYPPDGERGMFGGSRAAQYGAHGLGSAADLTQWLNTNTVLAVMIEDMSGVEEIEEIVRTPGLDMVIPGINDLSVAMGLAGQRDHPDLAAAVDRIVAAANAAGVRVALGPEYPVYFRTADQLREQGVWLLPSQNDAFFMLDGMRKAVERHKG